MDIKEIIDTAKIFDNSDLAYCIINVILDDDDKPCDWEFVYLNEALAKIEGLPKEQLLNKRFFEIFPNADKKWFKYYYPSAYEGKSFTFKDISEEIDVFLKIHCFPVAYGYCGCFLEDIKDLYDSLKRESEGDDVIRGLAKDYSTVCLVKSPYSTIQIYRNEEQALKTIKNSEKLTYNEAISEYINKFVFAEDRERIKKELDLCVVTKGIKNNNTYSVTYRCLFGEKIEYYQINFVSTDNSDGFIIGIRNINEIVKEQHEQKKALKLALESAKHANNAKTTFLSNMSHDIRTPMNAIMGFTTLALAHIENKEQVRDYLGKIVTSSNHLLSLINDILDMSRIESGRMTLENTECNLSEILHELRSILQSDLKSKNISFFIDTVDVYDEDVICDKLRLNQVLLNLLSNALKFTPSGGTICVRLIQKSGKNKEYGVFEFQVKDNGIGMSKEFCEHIFEPFEREHTSTVSGIQGTGLGMAISKNIIDMMDGEIVVNSDVGKGTEVIFSIPMKKSKPEDTEIEIEDFKQVRALVVDDDFNTCDSVSNILIKIGMRADWSMSGKEAVLRCRQAVQRQDPYQVYVIDWLIPDMNGIEVARNIRAIVGEDAPIIILTAYDWTDIEAEARSAGVTAFMSKPLFISDIRQCLIGILNSKKAESKEVICKKDFSKDKRILVVEDNELNREIVSDILSEAGIIVEEAENGKNAIDLLQSKEAGYYSLILMDIQMPIMDGYEATEYIRNMENKHLANIPIIAMTANAFEEDKKKALSIGMNYHLAKPINIDTMFDILKEFL